MKRSSADIRFESDNEYRILEHIIYYPKNTSQRKIASSADLSLGMTNAILKKLAQKGLLIMKRINSRNIQYAATPTGLTEIAKRSRKVVRQTIEHVAEYRSAIEQFIMGLKVDGYCGIRLLDRSELDFIIEWACFRHGIGFNQENTRKLVRVITEEELLGLIEDLK